jgi:anaerobic ribonucleoside-triphosphate reductase activating protein
MITFSEFPDEIALCINITNCPFHCSGCHSPELWEDIGTELTKEELSNLIEHSRGITCVGFMGGNVEEVNEFANFIKLHTNLKVGWYTGYSNFPKELEIWNYDYIKLGPYIKDRGPLNNPNTNQRMFKIEQKYIGNSKYDFEAIDITYKFWKHGEE